jgi:hypothetical protein
LYEKSDNQKNYWINLKETTHKKTRFTNSKIKTE